jgi:hypothetical protein
MPADTTTLTNLATAARDGDPAARNRLFTELAAPIAACVQAHRALCRSLEPDEVTSETFLALADLLEVWPDVPFPAFFQDVYGFCLRERLARVQPWHPRWRPFDPERWRATTPAPAAGAAHTVARLTRDLPPAALALLEGRADGVPIADLAPRLGLSPRQAQRRWHALVARLGG